MKPFDKMPWGYTVSWYMWFILGKGTHFPQGIFELENGGGLFGRVNIRHSRQCSNNLVSFKHESSRAEQPRLSGTLKVRYNINRILCC